MNVSKYRFNFNQPILPNMNKYKTMLCKHFETNKGCSFGDKCQFAHGASELRSNINNVDYLFQIIFQQNFPQEKQIIIQNMQIKKGPNPQNFKIVKCKYWEKGIKYIQLFIINKNIII